MAEFFTYDVPDGHPAMSLPVDETKRFTQGEIRIRRAEEKDLMAIAKGLYLAFPESWWSKHEPFSRRPPDDIRCARLAKRLKPSLSQPEIRFLVAEDTSTGALAGGAGWHLSGEEGKFFPCLFSKRTADDLRWKTREGWTDAEEAELWEAIDMDAWTGEFDANEAVRREVVGDEVHWYLSPLFVFEEYRGRGIGGMLLRWAIDQADAKSPRVAMYLEALPNARPVYMHYGFLPLEGEDRKTVMVRRSLPSADAL